MGSVALRFLGLGAMIAGGFAINTCLARVLQVSTDKRRDVSTCNCTAELGCGVMLRQGTNSMYASAYGRLLNS